MSVRARALAVRSRAARAMRNVAAAVRLVASRRDAVAVALGVGVAYLVGFLLATGDLSVRTDVTPGFLVVTDPVTRALARTGPASFDAVAILDTGVVRWLVSPGNVVIGGAVAALVGLNLAMTYLAVRQPAACGIGAGSGVLASAPALLSGTVCCGPVVLLALGVQASAALLTVFAWLLPLGVLLLLGSFAYVAGTLDPERGRTRTRSPNGN